MAIKAIIFDIGEVLIQEEASLARDILAKKYKFDSLKFKEYTKKNIAFSRKGQLPYLKYFKGLIEENSLKATPKQMSEDWKKARAKTSYWIKDNKKILEKLNKKYLTISFTNSTKLNDTIKIRKDSYKLFKINLISHKLNTRKPEKEFYTILLKKLKQKDIKPEESIFIEDREENIIPAKELGINTILYSKETNLKKELSKFGVEF
jgi:HAD superfamily hydrolase (TIGR01509 family)